MNGGRAYLFLMVVLIIFGMITRFWSSMVFIGSFDDMEVS